MRYSRVRSRCWPAPSTKKDPHTRGHSDHLTRYSLLIAKETNLPASFVETLQVSSCTTLARSAFDDHILKKTGALTEEEFEVIKTCTTKGANILLPVTQLAEMLPGVELHHEALDRRGYPYGLKGHWIPLLARVIVVADTFDALTPNRPYQQAHTPDQALIIKNLAGKRLDPAAVAGLLSAYECGEIKIQRFTRPHPQAPAPTVTPPTAPQSANLERSRVSRRYLAACDARRKGLAGVHERQGSAMASITLLAPGQDYRFLLAL